MAEDQIDQEIDRTNEIIAQSIEREEQTFRAYLTLYEMSNPKPRFGWFVKATATAIIALMLVAAMRTAFSFGLSAFTSLNQFLSQALDQNVILILSGIGARDAVKEYLAAFNLVGSEEDILKKAGAVRVALYRKRAEQGEAEKAYKAVCLQAPECPWKPKGRPLKPHVEPK